MTKDVPKCVSAFGEARSLLKTVRLIWVLLECQLGFTFYFNMCHSWINETRKPHYIISVRRVVYVWDSVVFLLITIMGMDAFTFYMLFVKDKDKKKQLQTWVDILIQGYSFLIQCLNTLYALSIDFKVFIICLLKYPIISIICFLEMKTKKNQRDLVRGNWFLIVWTKFVKDVLWVFFWITFCNLLNVYICEILAGFTMNLVSQLWQIRNVIIYIRAERFSWWFFYKNMN